MSHLAKKLLLASLLFYYCLEAQQLKLDVSATSAILIDGKTGKVLYEKNAHAISFPASTTKIATALYALVRKGNCLDEVITAKMDAVASVHPHVKRTNSSKHPPYRLEFGGTHFGIKTGEQLSFRMLLYGLMLVSGNDAANMIAEYVSGSVPKFLEEMNIFLKKLGCLETHFCTPHGLPCNEHTTSAFDLAHMTRAAMRNSTFREIVKTVTATRPATNKQQESIFGQSNALLRAGPHYYPKAIGVKTGYTLAAGHNLVAAAEDENRFLIAVLLNCPDMKKKYKDAIALFEAAFNEPKVNRTIFAKGFDRYSRSFKGGKNVMEACLHEDLTVEYYPSEDPEFQARLEWAEISLPIKQGDIVGELRLVSKDGKVIKSANIFAQNNVDRTLFAQIMHSAKKVKDAIPAKAAIVAFVISLISLVTWLILSKKRSLSR